VTSPISGITGSLVVAPVKLDAMETGNTGTTDGSAFASQLAAGLTSLEQTQGRADDLAVQAATGQLTDVHEYMIASSEAKLATDLTVAVRNKAVDAFNEIMRLQA
jgi:flagellar hook-basal body complex protein FliE